MIVMACGLVASAEMPAVMLESAKYQETTAKDPDAAVKIYEQIIAEADANRPYVAEAHYRLGTLYLRKGEQEKGVAEIRKVVEQYPDQVAFAAPAKVLLAKQTGEKGGGGGRTAASGAPEIVSTTPVAFATDVDPNLPAITVTFDQEMVPGDWSWTGGGETYPKVTGDIAYDATGKTCRLPVKLEPGKVYQVGINSPSYRSFKSMKGVPADWYMILFATKGADGKPTPIPSKMLNGAKRINARHHLAETSDGGASADELMQQGWQLWSQRKLPEAEQKFKASVEKDPNNANAWNGLGWAQFNQGKPNDAKLAFEKCVELDPKAAAALNGLGWIAKGKGDTKVAIGYWEKAVEAAPNATAAYNGLTVTYMELGQPQQAARYYEMWLKVEPDNVDAKAGLEKAKSKSQ
jgi:tetratricopeptide (TPR) repeat protein